MRLRGLIGLMGLIGLGGEGMAIKNIKSIERWTRAGEGETVARLEARGDGPARTVV